ncbi:hypothetical protein [Microvirga vignae]|uniref:hypothetical protein n=1 Tax=Microvirga vignae TaxID=1225564 RepID=UPI000AE3E3EC
MSTPTSQDTALITGASSGIGGAAPLLASDVDAMDRMIRLNVLAPTRLTYAGWKSASV